MKNFTKDFKELTFKNKCLTVITLLVPFIVLSHLIEGVYVTYQMYVNIGTEVTSTISGSSVLGSFSIMLVPWIIVAALIFSVVQAARKMLSLEKLVDSYRVLADVLRDKVNLYEAETEGDDNVKH